MNQHAPFDVFRNCPDHLRIGRPTEGMWKEVIQFVFVIGDFNGITYGVFYAGGTFVVFFLIWFDTSVLHAWISKC